MDGWSLAGRTPSPGVSPRCHHGGSSADTVYRSQALFSSHPTLMPTHGRTSCAPHQQPAPPRPAPHRPRRRSALSPRWALPSPCLQNQGGMLALVTGAVSWGHSQWGLTLTSLLPLSHGDQVPREEHRANDHVSFSLFPCGERSSEAPATPRCPLRSRKDLTVGIMAAEAAAGPSLHGVEPPGKSGGLAVACLAAAADVPGAFHGCPSRAGWEHCHQSPPLAPPSLGL